MNPTVIDRLNLFPSSLVLGQTFELMVNILKAGVALCLTTNAVHTCWCISWIERVMQPPQPPPPTLFLPSPPSTGPNSEAYDAIIYHEVSPMSYLNREWRMCSMRSIFTICVYLNTYICYISITKRINTCLHSYGVIYVYVSLFTGHNTTHDYHFQFIGIW